MINVFAYETPLDRDRQEGGELIGEVVDLDGLKFAILYKPEGSVLGFFDTDQERWLSYSEAIKKLGGDDGHHDNQA